MICDKPITNTLDDALNITSPSARGDADPLAMHFPDAARRRPRIAFVQATVDSGRAEGRWTLVPPVS